MLREALAITMPVVALAFAYNYARSGNAIKLLAAPTNLVIAIVFGFLLVQNDFSSSVASTFFRVMQFVMAFIFLCWMVFFVVWALKKWQQSG
jgi:cell division protein FtsW (lipid II flippase)